MSDTAARLLRLLGLLQSRAPRSGTELAERLGVTARTVRRDVDHLRELGYPVEADRGVAGYQLGAGGVVPPLLLDDDEAVAIAVGLRTSAAVGGVSGIEDSTLRALAKLETILPSGLHRRVRALSDAVQPLAVSGPSVPADLLMIIAAACRDHQQLHIAYRRHDDTESTRVVEPLTVVHTGKRWYLVAWDPDHDDWRTLRIDRMTLRGPPGQRFEPRDPPDPNIAHFVSRGIATALWPYRAEVRVLAPHHVVTERDIPQSWVVRPDGDGASIVEAGAENPRRLALYLLGLDLEFEVEANTELAEELARTARLHRIRESGTHPTA